jgi:phenylacetate-coenzyme A ligase PaaK-like adenylate-forming protein
MRPLYSARRLRDVGRALRLARGLEARERWTPEELLAYQQRQLSALLRHAAAASPFYRERSPHALGDTGIALDELPVLTKSELMASFDRLVTDSRLRLGELEAHVASLARDEYYLGEYRVMATSGTTGERALIVYGRREWSLALAAVLRWMAMMGISPRLPRRMSLAAIGAPSPVHVSNRYSITMDVGLHRMLRLPATADIEELTRALNAFGPEAVIVYASIAGLLAIEQLEGRLRIRPRVVSTTSEVLSDEVRARIRAAWGVEPYNLYAMTEAGIVASECAEHRGLHAYDDLAILEVVDEAGHPVPPGTPGQRLLVTNLVNRAQPLIRYEVSDLIVAAKDPCPCGRPLRLLTAVEGRSDEILHLPGAGGRNVSLHPVQLHGAMSALAEVRQYQLVQDRDGLRALVALRGDARPHEATARIALALREALLERGVAPANVRVGLVERIEREGGSAAKLKTIKPSPRAPQPTAN